MRDLSGPLGGVVARWQSNPEMGPAVRRIRRELGLSEAELGRRLPSRRTGEMGVSQEFVSRMERGGVPMDPQRVTEVARALGVSIQRVYAESRKNFRAEPPGSRTKSDGS